MSAAGLVENLRVVRVTYHYREGRTDSAGCEVFDVTHNRYMPEAQVISMSISIDDTQIAGTLIWIDFDANPNDLMEEQAVVERTETVIIESVDIRPLNPIEPPSTNTTIALPTPIYQEPPDRLDFPRTE